MLSKIHLILSVLLAPTALAAADFNAIRGDFMAALTSCDTIARTWIRAAFHDSGTFDPKSGDGGTDGSLQFELNRGENLGLEPTINFYKGIAQRRRISMADAIVFGGNLAVEICGGPKIPFKPGRIDATGPNPTGTILNIFIII
jgi:hypothetical protein